MKNDYEPSDLSIASDLTGIPELTLNKLIKGKAIVVSIDSSTLNAEYINNMEWAKNNSDIILQG